MLYYLDTSVVIYAVEGNQTDQQRALFHLSTLELADHRFVISELTITECLVPLLGPGDGARLSDFFRFFHGPNLRIASLNAASHFRAAAIRGGSTHLRALASPQKRYGLADSLHLAAAIEFGCDVFLTNDNQLSNFQEIHVEELP